MQSRRKFIANVSRGAILTGIFSISGYLLLKENGENENCDFEFICKNCKKVKACELQEAQEYKNENPLNHKNL